MWIWGGYSPTVEQVIKKNMKFIIEVFQKSLLVYYLSKNLTENWSTSCFWLKINMMVCPLTVEMRRRHGQCAYLKVKWWGSSLGWGTLCFILGRDNLLLEWLSLLRCIKGALANLMWGVTLRWTSIPSRGSRNTPGHFMLLYENWR